MILADDPTKRHMCPVTIFLAMAIADGVISSGQLDSQFPQWKMLQYAVEKQRLAVWRRCLPYKPILSSRELKSSVLLDQLKAQISRAGHEDTWKIIVDDNKRASRREKQRMWTIIVAYYYSDHLQGLSEALVPHLLLGRGQGRTIFNLLTPHLAPISNMPWEASTFAKCSQNEKPQALCNIVKLQMRYDLSRCSIVTLCFDKIWGSFLRLQDTLWAFQEAAAHVAPEPYYDLARPDSLGNCPYCSLSIDRYIRISAYVILADFESDLQRGNYIS